MNRDKLLGIIEDMNISQRQLAEAIHVSKNTMCSKLNGKGTFTVDEAKDICRFLNIKKTKLMVDIFLR